MTSSLPNKYLNISWEKLHHDAKALAEILCSKGSWDKIVAITRGGLIPAAIIAKELNIRIIDTVCIASYDDKVKGSLNILKNTVDDEENILIIDDLVDTGETAKTVRQMFPNAFYATLYAKSASSPHVDLFITEVSQDTWIVFP